jgi:hypothetical protein
VALCAAIGAYAGLLPAGRWHYDEYMQGALSRDLGWRYLLHRLAGESPRPVSETVLFAYYRLVAAVHRPLIEWFLLLHWLVLLVACLASARWRTGERLLWRGLMAAALLCLFLMGRDDTELFFWPAGVAPYLETLAALCLLQFLMLDGRLEDGAGRLAGIAALTVAAAASEAGAMFALPYAALRLLGGARGRFGWALPLATAVGLLGLIAVSRRLASAEPVMGPSATLHHPLASVLAALPHWWHELAGLDGMAPARRRALATGLLVKGLLFLGLRWCWRGAAPDSRRPDGAWVFAVAAALATFGVIAAAEYQYGMNCCARHAALRQCLVLLAIAGLAAATAPERLTRHARLAAPACLLLAAALPFVPSLPGLIADYRLRPATIQARAATWRSGLSPGPAMTWYPPPSGRLIAGGELPPGHFESMSGLPPWDVGVLMFFHKQVIDVVPLAPP